MRINSAQSTTKLLSPGPSYAWLWISALVVLPFASYLSLAMLVVLMVLALCQRFQSIQQTLWRQGYGVLALGLLVSACFAVNRGDAWLQLANFFPYFLLVGVLHTAPQFKSSHLIFKTIAQAVVLGSLPFSVAALVEYIVRFPSIATRVDDWPIFQWVFDVSFVGHRAHGGLSHPNILSNYLVIVLGLGLGLLLQTLRSRSRPPSQMTSMIATATAMAAMGIFFTSSRNGLLAGLILLLIAGYLARRHRWVWLVGLLSLGIVATGLIFLGFGGRGLSLALFTQDPRVAAWQMALDLIHQRPLVGWGLGGFSHQYVPFSVIAHERLFHPHNLWLYLACDTGIPTLLLFCYVVGRPYMEGIRRLLEKQSSPILLSYVLAFSGCILFNLFDVTLFDARINVLSWFSLASISTLVSSSHQQPQ